MEKNNAYSEIKKFGLLIMPINWVICLVVTLLLHFLVSEEWALGYLLGSVTSYLTFGLHMKGVDAFGTNEKISVVRKAFSSYIVRFMFSAGMLTVAWYLPQFELIATFIGMLVIKVVLIIFAIIRELVNKKSASSHKDVSKDLSASEMANMLNNEEGGMKEEND